MVWLVMKGEACNGWKYRVGSRTMLLQGHSVTVLMRKKSSAPSGAPVCRVCSYSLCPLPRSGLFSRSSGSLPHPQGVHGRGARLHGPSVSEWVWVSAPFEGRASCPGWVPPSAVHCQARLWPPVPLTWNMPVGKAL